MQQQEGTGLGLTLSKRILELLGGRMWLKTEVGVGSTFGFAVPVGHNLKVVCTVGRAGDPPEVRWLWSSRTTGLPSNC